MNRKLLLASLAGMLISLSLRFQSHQNHHPQISHAKILNGSLDILPLEHSVGPESFAFDPAGGGPYTGVSGGRILKWDGEQRRWIEFAVTSSTRGGCEGQHGHEEMEHICGRPLGLMFNYLTGELYIADAYKGLLVVGPNGGLATPVLTEAQGIPFAFTNSLDIDQNTGTVFFTDSSSQFQRRKYMSVVLSGETTGRLMKYDPKTNQVTVLLDNLSFANGVALTKDGNSVLVAETAKFRVLKYWLKTSKAGALEVFSNLPGFPDNIRRSPRGGYWVGIFSKKKKLSEWILAYPWIGKALLKLPFDSSQVQKYSAKWRGNGMAVRVSEEGEILEIFEDTSSGYRGRSVTEVEEINGTLWIGSVNMPFAAILKL